MKIYVFEDLDKIPYKVYRDTLKHMPKSRLEKINLYRFINNKYQSAIGYMLLKIAIKKEFGIVLNNNEIWKYNEYGKPSLLLYPNIYFNISHCKNTVVCAIGRSEVGVDVQEIVEVDRGVIEQFYFKEEIDIINNVDNQDEVFTAMWSLKESYIKYLGIGIGEYGALKKFLKVKDGYTYQYNHNFFLQYNEDYILSSCCDDIVEICKCTLEDLVKI